MDYSVWYTSGDYKSIDFLYKLRPFQERLDKLATCTPHIACRACSFGDSDGIVVDNTPYCPPITVAPSGSGLNPLKVGLTEMCMYEEYRALDNGKKWWDYIVAMHACTGKRFTQACVNEAQSTADIDMTLLSSCIMNAQSKLPAEYQRWKEASLNVNPAVVISNKVYRVS